MKISGAIQLQPIPFRRISFSSKQSASLPRIDPVRNPHPKGEYATILIPRGEKDKKSYELVKRRNSEYSLSKNGRMLKVFILEKKIHAIN
jgi:hypothetical protein